MNDKRLRIYLDDHLALMMAVRAPNLFVQEIDVFDDDLADRVRLTLDGRKMKNHGVPLDNQMHVFVAVDVLETKPGIELQ